MKPTRSCRRILLNQLIKSYFDEFSGRTLDVGGVRNTKRIDVDLSSIGDYTILNSNPEAKPDLLLDANDLSSISQKPYNTILSFEVIEYLNDPSDFLRSLYDLLQPKGKMYISLPLHHTIHGDFEFDQWRMTEAGLKNVFKEKNISKYEIIPMGGIFSVIYDLIFAHLIFNSLKPLFLSKIFLRVMIKCQSLILKMDKVCLKNSRKLITTGYFIRIEKNG